MDPAKNDRPLLYFDGVCGLCNRSVDFILQHDQHEVFLFAALQSSFAAQQLPKEWTTDLSSLVLSHGGQFYRKSAAVFKIASLLGWPWKLAGAFSFLPTKLCDAVYDWVARSRYQWFGQLESCRLPSPSERARFLDEGG